MRAMAEPRTPPTEEPAHDVLAADEYPLGGGEPAGSGSLVRHPDGKIRRGVLLAAIGLAALMALQRLKRGRG